MILSLAQKVYLFIFICLLGCHPGKVQSIPFGDPASSQSPREQKHNINLAPGTEIFVSLDRSLGSNLSRQGEIAYGHVLNAEELHLPEGIVVEMITLSVQRSQRFLSKPGSMKIAANRFILPGGQSVWMRGLVVDAWKRSDMKGSSTARRIGVSLVKIAAASGAGAVTGLAVAGIADGGLGAGAVAGTAIGGGAGVLWATLSKGKELVLPAGSRLRIVIAEGVSSHY